MKNNIAIICGAVLALFPYVTRADIDPTTFIQDQLVNYQKDVEKALSKYIGYQMNLQQLVNSRDVLGELKRQGKTFAIDAAMKYGSNIKIRTLSIGGLKDAISGSVATPTLAKTVGINMSRNNKVENDTSKAIERKKMLNKLQVENTAIMYAKALVTRKAIINENTQIEEEEKTEPTDLTQVIDAYKKVSQRADGRWKQILDSQANYYGQLAAVEFLNATISKVEDDAKTKTTEENSTNTTEDNSKNTVTSNEGNGTQETSVTDLYNQGRNTVNAISNGNYSGALDDIGNTIGGDIGTYISTSGGAYNSGSSVVSGISNGNNIEDILGNIGSGISNAADSLGQDDNKNSQETSSSDQSGGSSDSSSKNGSNS